MPRRVLKRDTDGEAAAEGLGSRAIWTRLLSPTMHLIAETADDLGWSYSPHVCARSIRQQYAVFPVDNQHAIWSLV